MIVRLVGAGSVAVDLGLYAVYAARRLDRLHARVDAAASGLDAQLRRRSEVAATFALAVPLPSDLGIALASAATEATFVTGLGHDREVAENALSKALSDVIAGAPGAAADAGAIAVELHDDAVRAAIARTFYNDAVRNALLTRDRRVVRWLHLAGTAPHPAYFEMDDGDVPTWVPRRTMAG